MDFATKNGSFQPRPLAELLPGLSGILSKDAVLTLTAKKQPRNKVALTSTAVKNIKPLTIAEMRADILALKVPSSKKCAPPTTSTKKRIWNCSVKVENKSKSHTTNEQLKHNSVRKALNFQQKPKSLLNPKMPVTPETPKFPRPEFRAKKLLQVQAQNDVRISGICNIPKTPVIINKQIKNCLTQVNKENSQPKRNINVKPHHTVVNKKSIVPSVPTVPQLNMSWKSDADNSFLQKEKEIEQTEDNKKVIAEETMLEFIAQESPPVSTPFKEYRNVEDFFNHSDDIDDSALYSDNTIMCFDKMSTGKDNNKREESVIVSLCDLLNKGTITNVDVPKTELNDLLEVEKQLEHNIKMVENGIKTLNNIKDSQLQSLEYVKRIINEKRTCSISDNKNNIIIKEKKQIEKDNKHIEINSVSNKSCSVIKAKSPSYKIPKKNQCLRRKVLYKSMPNVSNGMHTPKKEMEKRAFDMYMEMKTKGQMSFLNTPCMKRRNLDIPDTPSVTSHNLQMQLDKIYKDNT